MTGIGTFTRLRLPCEKAYRHGVSMARPRGESSFAWSTCPSASLAFGDRAPKQITTPEYAFAANYGYHLDAGAFAQLLTQHGVEQLGVRHHRLDIKETLLSQSRFD